MGARKPSRRWGANLPTPFIPEMGSLSPSLGADRSEGYVASVRALFWIYSTVIALGLAYFIVIGLTHH